MTPDDLEKLAELASEKTAEKMCAAKRAQWIDPDTHSDHHRWTAEQIALRAERRAMYRKVAESGLTWAFLLFLGFLAVAAWQSFVQHIKVPTP